MMEKNILAACFSIIICLSVYGQEDEIIRLDSTKITLIGNKIYKAHQGYQKSNDSTYNTLIQYSEVNLSNVLFKTSTALLLPVSYNALNALVILLRDNPNFNLKIEGHTDKVGHPQSNLRLSIKRANTIKIYMIRKGIDAKRMTASGYGDQFPICEPPCIDNQRVEFTLVHDGSEQKLVTRKWVEK